MLKLLGVCLLIGGCVGFAGCLCREGKSTLFLLKEIKYMYRLIQAEILATALPLPEIFCQISVSLSEPLQKVLYQVGSSMTLEERESFAHVWKKKIFESIKGYKLKKKYTESLLRFPDLLNPQACSGQTEALQRQIEELEIWIAELEEEEKNRNKVIMSLGVATGVFLVILLL